MRHQFIGTSICQRSLALSPHCHDCMAWPKVHGPTFLTGDISDDMVLVSLYYSSRWPCFTPNRLSAVQQQRESCSEIARATYQAHLLTTPMYASTLSLPGLLYTPTFMRLSPEPQHRWLSIGAPVCVLPTYPRQDSSCQHITRNSLHCLFAHVRGGGRGAACRKQPCLSP